MTEEEIQEMKKTALARVGRELAGLRAENRIMRARLDMFDTLTEFLFARPQSSTMSGQMETDPFSTLEELIKDHPNA